MKQPIPNYQDETIQLVSVEELKKFGLLDSIQKSEQRTRYEIHAAKHPDYFNDKMIRLVLRAYRFGMSFAEIQSFFTKIGKPLANFALNLILQDYCQEFSTERWNRARKRAALNEFLKERVKNERSAFLKVRNKYPITGLELRQMLEEKGLTYNEKSFRRKN